MAFKDRVVNLYLKGKDLFTPESKKTAAAIAVLSEKASKLREALTGVSQAERDVAKARALEEHLKAAEQQVSETTAALGKITTSYDELKLATRSQADASKKAVAEADKATAAYKKQQASLETYNAELRASGVNINKLSKTQKEYEARIASVKKELDDLAKAESLLTKSQGLEAHLKEVADSLGQAKAKVKQYADAIDKSSEATKAQRTELKLAEQAQGRLQKEYDSTKAKLASMEASLSSVAAGNSKLVKSQTALASKTSELNAELAELKRIERDISAANKLSASLQQSKNDMAAAADKAKRLTQEYHSNEIQLSQLSREMQSASSSAARADRNYGKTLNTLSLLKEKLKGAGIETDDLAASHGKLRSEMERLQGAIAKNRSELKAMGARLEVIKDKAKAAAHGIKGLAGDLLAMGGAYIGIREIGGALNNLLTTAGKFEDFRAQLSGLYDDQAKGEAAFAWIREFARDTPNTVGQVTEAFLLLKNNGMEPMNGTLRKLIAANAKYGRGQETLIPIIRQLSQAWGKNQITAEDAGTAIENGLPVWELLAKATGRSVGELRKMSENSLLTRKHLALLFDEMENSSLGTMAARMNTWNAQVTKFKDQWGEALDLVASSGVLEFFKNELTDINKEVRAMAEDGRLKAVASEWADWIISTASSTKKFVTSLVTDLDDLALKTSQMMGGVQIAFNLFTGAVKLAGAQITGFMASVAVARAELLSAFGADDMAKEARDAAGAILAVHEAFKKESLQDAKDIAEGWDKLTGQAYQSAKKQFTDLGGAAGEAAKNQRKLIDEMISSAGNIEDLINSQEEAFKTLGVNSAEVMNNLARDARAAYEEIKAGDAPLAQQQKAFLSYAAAVIKASAASGESVDVTLSHEAAVLNLSASYDKLIEKYGESSSAVKKLSDEERAATAERVKLLQEETDAARARYLELQAQAKEGKATTEQLNAAAQELVSTSNELYTAQALLSASSSAQTKALGDGVKVTLAAAKANAELARVNYDDIRQAFKEGRRSAQDLADAHDEMTKASNTLVRALKAEGKEVKGAAALMGDYGRAATNASLATEQALRRQEKAAKKAYTETERSFSAGTASAEELKKSFLEWADASIQVSVATDKTVSSAIQSQAATLGLSAEIEVLIDKYRRLRQAQQGTETNAGETADKVVKGAKDMKDAIGEVGTAGAAAAAGIGNIAAHFSSIGFAISQQVKELSAGAYAYFQTLVHGFKYTADASTDLEKAKSRVQELSDIISEIENEKLRRADFVGLRTWALELERKAKVAEQAYYRQKIQVLELTDALEDADQVNLNMIARAERAVGRLKLVDDQTMDNLTRSIERAKDSMEGLRESASDTLNQLKDELDEFENRQADIEKRRYQQEKADITSQLDAAKQSGDKAVIRQMEEALKTLEKVYKYRQASVKQQQQEDEQRAKEEAEREKSTQEKEQASPTSSTTRTTATYQAPASSQGPLTATLYLHLEGKSTSVTTTPSDLSGLLGMINAAKLTQGG